MAKKQAITDFMNNKGIFATYDDTWNVGGKTLQAKSYRRNKNSISISNMNTPKMAKAPSLN